MCSGADRAAKNLQGPLGTDIILATQGVSGPLCPVSLVNTNLSSCSCRECPKGRLNLENWGTLHWVLYITVLCKHLLNLPL